MQTVLLVDCSVHSTASSRSLYFQHSHDREDLEGAHRGIVIQGQGVPDHRVLHIIGAQHFQALCLLRKSCAGNKPEGGAPSSNEVSRPPACP